MWADLKKLGRRLAGPRPLANAGQADVAMLAKHAREFKQHLLAFQSTRPDVQWYPYDSFANFEAFQQLLTPPYDRPLALAGTDPILDAGCADGVMSFFLESLGYPLHAVDYPPTNHNQMQGLWALHKYFDSAVKVHAVDLDAQFTLPQVRYGLAFFLGILYHLKNPYYALETLASHARYCLLSTRIARVAPDRQTALEPLPVAYLLDPGETNDDWTNFWIFTETGLRRLLDRTGWDVLQFITTGYKEGSDPNSADRDERAFCLLRSRSPLMQARAELLEGWHELEAGNWRWTAQRFAVSIETHGSSAPAVIQLHFSIHAASLKEHETLTLTATVDGQRLPAQEFNSTGPQLYAQAIPGDALALGEAVRVEFTLSHALPRTEQDQRSLGVQVSFGDPAGPVRLTR